MRGLIEAVKRGCHIVNMSYGEATAWDNYGEYWQLMCDYGDYCVQALSLLLLIMWSIIIRLPKKQNLVSCFPLP
jgi:hypothetical protein